LDDAKVLAGGQSLVPLLNFRLARPAHLVDINRIPNLNRIYERDGGVAVQALARQADVEDSELVARRCPLLLAAVRLVAHRVIRNRGTVCGSLAHADPASELPAVLLALRGHVVARSTRGSRIIPAADFFTGVMETKLATDELLVEAWFPASTGRFAIAEESRRHGDFALAGAVRYGDRLALFGVAPTPVLADRNDPTYGLQPSGDLEASPEFRLHLVQILTEKVFAT
jgi:CO/xanthine dehydrogenase FAD-binding subunit